MIRAFLKQPIRSSRRLLSTGVTDCILQANSVPLPVTTTLHIHDTTEDAKIPVFRMLDPSGRMLVDQEVDVDEALATKMYQHMVRIHYLDDILYNAQRQGRISFYMQAQGEEAIHIGKAPPIAPCSLSG